MWIRAVWLESGQEEEGVIPESWAKDGNVYWPPGVNTKKVMDKKLAPLPSWRKFPLRKIKFTSECREDCELYDQTTTVESSDEDTVTKRKRQRRKGLEDFVTELSTDQEKAPSPEEKIKKQAISGLEDIALPVPPKKVSSETQEDQGTPVSITTQSKSCSNTQFKNTTTPRSISGSIPRSKTIKSRSPFIFTQLFSRPDSSSRSRSRSPAHISSTPCRRSRSRSRTKSQSFYNRLAYSRSRSRTKSQSFYNRHTHSRSRSRTKTQPTYSQPLSRSRSRTNSKSSCSRHTRSRSKSRTNSQSSFSRHTRSRSRSRTKSQSSYSRHTKSRSRSRTKSQSSYSRHTRSRSKSRTHSQSSFSRHTRSRSWSRPKSQSSYIRHTQSSSKSRGNKETGPSSQNRLTDHTSPSMSAVSQNIVDKFPVPEARFQKRVLFLLNDIKSEIQELKRGKVLDQQSSDSIFQATNLEEFQQLEEKAKVPEEWQNMVKCLSSIGGSSLKDTVKNVMEKVMTNELMAQFNMKGNRQKVGFRSSRLCNLVVASAMKSSRIGESTEYGVLQAVQSCLKYAPDRRGGGGRKKHVL